MEYAYEFAGLLLKIKAEDEALYSDHGVLTPFVSVSKRDGPCLSFELSDKILPPEGECIYEDNQDVYEDYHANTGIIKEAIVLPDNDLLLGFYIITDTTADEIDEHRHLQYYKLSEIRMEYRPVDMEEYYGGNESE